MEYGLLKVCGGLETTHLASAKDMGYNCHSFEKGVLISSKLLECILSDTEEFMMDVQSAKRFMQYVCEGLHRL